MQAVGSSVDNASFTSLSQPPSQPTPFVSRSADDVPDLPSPTAGSLLGAHPTVGPRRSLLQLHSAAAAPPDHQLPTAAALPGAAAARPAAGRRVSRSRTLSWLLGDVPPLFIRSGSDQGTAAASAAPEGVGAASAPPPASSAQPPHTLQPHAAAAGTRDSETRPVLEHLSTELLMHLGPLSSIRTHTGGTDGLGRGMSGLSFGSLHSLGSLLRDERGASDAANAAAAGFEIPSPAAAPHVGAVAHHRAGQFAQQQQQPQQQKSLADFAAELRTQLQTGIAWKQRQQRQQQLQQQQDQEQQACGSLTQRPGSPADAWEAGAWDLPGSPLPDCLAAALHGECIMELPAACPGALAEHGMHALVAPAFRAEEMEQAAQQQQQQYCGWEDLPLPADSPPRHPSRPVASLSVAAAAELHHIKAACALLISDLSGGAAAPQQQQQPLFDEAMQHAGRLQGGLSAAAAPGFGVPYMQQHYEHQQQHHEPLGAHADEARGTNRSHSGSVSAGGSHAAACANSPAAWSPCGPHALGVGSRERLRAIAACSSANLHRMGPGGAAAPLTAQLQMQPQEQELLWQMQLAQYAAAGHAASTPDHRTLSPQACGAQPASTTPPPAPAPLCGTPANSSSTALSQEAIRERMVRVAESVVASAAVTEASGVPLMQRREGRLRWGLQKTSKAGGRAGKGAGKGGGTGGAPRRAAVAAAPVAVQTAAGNRSGGVGQQAGWHLQPFQQQQQQQQMVFRPQHQAAAAPAPAPSPPMHLATTPFAAPAHLLMQPRQHQQWAALSNPQQQQQQQRVVVLVRANSAANGGGRLSSMPAILSLASAGSLSSTLTAPQQQQLLDSAMHAAAPMPAAPALAAAAPRKAGGAGTAKRQPPPHQPSSRPPQRQRI